jgi:hypothetical protein
MKRKTGDSETRSFRLERQMVDAVSRPLVGAPPAV